MAKALRARSTRSAPADTGEWHALVDQGQRRFPQPARPEQRYSVESPFLAVVNARGPWGVWLHERANPPFIPLCVDLLDKDFWRKIDNDQRVFIVTVWLQMAREDVAGIVWGDPVRLCHEWGLEKATFTERLERMIQAGLVCYLTPAEAEGARSCPLDPKAARPAWLRAGKGRERRGKGGGIKRGEKEEASQSKGSQSKTREESVRTAGSQVSSSTARTMQILGSKGEQASKSEQSKSQHRAQAQPQGTEPANLPKSDPGAAGGPPRTPGGVRGRTTHRRPRSVSQREPQRLDDALAWCNPRAVEFGRAMYAASHGRPAPPDLMAATDDDKADVGVWVHYWVEHVAGALPPERYAEFQARCERDVEKARRKRGIRNLGAVARGGGRNQGIVPGVLAAMRTGKDR